jgi:hypothetical protein
VSEGCERDALVEVTLRYAEACDRRADDPEA